MKDMNYYCDYGTGPDYMVASYLRCKRAENPGKTDRDIVCSSYLVAPEEREAVLKAMAHLGEMEASR